MSGTIDLETEKEAINLIQNLKSKNTQLIEDLKKKEFIIKLKDERIAQLENRIKKIQVPVEGTGKSDQVGDVSPSASEEIKLLMESDTKMKSQLFAKDRIICDFEQKIKELERQVNNQRLQLLEKNESSSSMQHELSVNRFNNYNRVLGENEGKLHQLLGEKNVLEQKCNELVDIIKNQSNELKVSTYIHCY